MVWVLQSVRVGADLAVLRVGAALRIAHHLAGHHAVTADRVRVNSADCSAVINPIYLPALGKGSLQCGVWRAAEASWCRIAPQICLQWKCALSLGMCIDDPLYMRNRVNGAVTLPLLRALTTHCIIAFAVLEGGTDVSLMP